MMRVAPRSIVEASRVHASRIQRPPVPRPPRARDRGTIAIVAALAFVVLIGMGALVVDGGYLAMRRRSMQGVADAAALAGAWSLPTSATAITQARANATLNGYTHGGAVTVTVNSPYSSDPRRIEVIVQTNVPTFLGRALGINTGWVRGRAVGQIPPPSPSVFAGDTVCGGMACGMALCINGTDWDIPGSVHSNSSLMLGGDATDSVAGAVEYGSGCTAQVNGPIGVASGPTSVATQPYPLSWVMADFPCTYSMAGTFDVSQPGAWWQSGNAWGGGGVLRPGTYCAPSGLLQLNGSNISGNVTFVSSGGMQISGQNLNMTAFRNNTFLYTTSNANPAIVMGSQTLTWTGSIFAPNGVINISGQDFNITGGIVGKNVFLGATRWTFNGSGGSTAPYLSE